MSNTLSRQQLVSHINQKFGKNTLMSAIEAAGLSRVRCPFGIAGIDILLNGGLVEGKIHQIRGNESSSKTTHSLKFALSYLRKYPDGVFIFVDAEDSSDVDFLRLLGFSTDELERTYYIPPGSGERAGDVTCEIASLSEKVVIVIDSVDTLTPSAELDTDMEKAGVSPGARMMNKFMRKLVPVMQAGLDADSPRCTVLLICQLREKIGVMFGSPATTWGGKGKNFAASTIIDLARTAYLYDGKGKTRFTYAMNVAATLNKCKGPSQGDSAEYTFYKANHDIHKNGTFDDIDALLTWGVRLSIIQKKANTYVYDDLSGIGAKFSAGLQGDAKIRKKLFAEIVAKRKELYGISEPTTSKTKKPTTKKRGLTRG